MFSSSSCIEYVNIAIKFIDDEVDRFKKYGKAELTTKILNINIKYIIDEKAEALAKKESGYKDMILNDKFDDLRQCYIFVKKSSKTQTWKTLSDSLEEMIKHEVSILTQNKEISSSPISKIFLNLEFIPELIKLKKKYDFICNDLFQNDIIFQDSKYKTFNLLLNLETYAKLLAAFADYEMRVGIKGMNERTIEDKLNDISSIFRCLANKLTFKLDHQSRLGDRLIQGKSISIISEKTLISKLKSEAGVNYVSTMTSMIKDIENSKNELDEYRKSKNKV